MLDTLSTELIERIASFLEGRYSHGSLRLVCRLLHNATLPTVASAWFGTLETDLCPRSIKRLGEISRNETFRLAVRTIRTGPRCVRRHTWWSNDWLRERSRPGSLSRQMVQRQVDTGPGCGAGRPEALGVGYSWPRLESGALDLSSETVREIQAVITAFVGVTAIEVNDDMGLVPSAQGTATHLSPNDALNLFLSILSISQNKLCLQGFRVRFDRHCAFMNANRLPQSTVNSTALRTAWSRLEHLDISWWCQEKVVDRTLGLISAATNMKTLGLNLSTRATDEFFLRLANEEETPIVPPICNLRLGHMNIRSSTTFADAVARFRHSLKSLQMTRMSIGMGNKADFFACLAQHEFPFFERVTALELAVRHRRMLFCPLRTRQHTLRSCGGVFEFATSPILNKERVVGVRYSGNPAGTQLALRAMGEEGSYYILLPRDRARSPGLQDMKEYTGDAVGRLVEYSPFWRSVNMLPFP